MEWFIERSYDILSPRPEECEARNQDEDVCAVHVKKGLHMAKSYVDEHDGVNPMWNEVMKVKSHKGLPKNDVMETLNDDIYAHSCVREKPVGSARVSLLHILKGKDTAKPVDNQIQCLTMQFWRPSGIAHGCLSCGFHVCILLLCSGGERGKG